MSTKPSRILVLTCSTRPNALAPTVGAWFTQVVATHATRLGAELVPVSLAELDLPFLDEADHPAAGLYRGRHSREWSALVDSVDGIVFVVPEYNHGMPAALKNALDYLGREWAWKSAGFVSYGYTSAGTRSVQHARPVLSALRLVPTGATVALHIGDALVDGCITQDARRDDLAARLLDEVVRLGHALRPMREALRAAAQAGPVPGAYVRRLASTDAPDVLVLQRCCWLDEALANATLGIPALHEDLDDVRTWIDQWATFGLWRDGTLLGMVRARREGGAWHIGRLAVAPHLRGTGTGRWLLAFAEREADPACDRAELETGAGSAANIRLYMRAGFQRSPGRDTRDVVHLVKPLAPRDPRPDDAWA